MPVLQLSEVSLAYGHFPLLDHAALVVEPGERIGLIGRNGTGKSTLLRLIAGEAVPDEGSVWLEPGLEVASVPQEPAFEPGLTVHDAVSRGLDEHTPAHRVAATLSRMGLDEEAAVDSLSGGMRKRVALARALVREPRLLLLDEPTNHLDIGAIEWLEETLLAFRGATLLVTHDRRFLDRVAQRIVELDRGRLASFPGNFCAYEQRKAEMLAIEEVRARKFDKVLGQEEAWIRRGVQARRTRDEGRVRRLEALRRERAQRRERIGHVELTLAAAERSGRLVAELEHATKRYDGRAVVEDFSARFMRGDKVGLIGPNGSGKTTLLKLILGEIAPDAGTVRLGTRVEVAYFDQFRAALDDEATLADTISPGSDTLDFGATRKHVISYLGDFLFPPERARAPVKTLSGGERNRLLLARLFSRPANVLVLDEPTNDLDIETLELLEALLQDFDGTLFLVSHDRAFLDNVVTQTIAYEGDGRWKEYAGGYDDWVRASRGSRPGDENRRPGDEHRRPRVGGDPIGIGPPPARERQRARTKLTYKETRELEELPARLEALEAEQRELSARLADPALYQDRTVDLRALNARHEAIEGELLDLLHRWEELENRKA